jgi:anthranilate synthase component 1
MLAAPVRPGPGVSPRAAYSRAGERLADAVSDLAAPTAQPPRDARLEQSRVDIVSNTPEADFFAMVERARDYIAAGDIFQVVLSQRFETPFAAPPFELYRALRRTNPSPFLFFLNFDACALVGSSPEILVRVRNGEVTIRPIAGTRPRGATPEEDRTLERDLLADPKERAEHLMLLDLGRNDVGRAAAIGTVKVTDSFAIERYSHVMHIVSNVVGDLAPGMHPVDAVAAGFPAGTVTGAPKIRAMEIIDELERDARGPYGGAIGYFSADGNVDTCIALRTAVVKDGRMYVQAGAGVVADSDPAYEQRECEAKARALFAAANALARSGN